MKIRVNVDLDATPTEITAAVVKQLTTKMIPGTGKLLGDAVSVIDADMVIHVVREAGLSKVEQAGPCPICNTLFLKSQGKKSWTNYGGEGHSIYVCSTECRHMLVSAFPGRVCTTRRNLKPIRTF